MEALESLASPLTPHGYNAHGGVVRSLPEQPALSDADLCRYAAEAAAHWQSAPQQLTGAALRRRLDALAVRWNSYLETARRHAGATERAPAAERPDDSEPIPSSLSPLQAISRELLTARRLLASVLTATHSDLPAFQQLPHVVVSTGEAVPRALALVESYLSVAGGVWSYASVTTFVLQVQKSHTLLLQELYYLPQALKLAHLKFVLDRAGECFAETQACPDAAADMAAAIHSLSRLNQFEWRKELEPMISFDAILREDPSGTFATMDEETRTAYRKRVAELARRADLSEPETARVAIDMARQAQAKGDPDWRRAQRIAHVGFYLFAEGLPALKHRIGYHAPLAEVLRGFLRRYNEDFYLIGIITVSLLFIVPIIAPLVPHQDFSLVMLSLLLALLPVTQGAVDMINGIVSSVLKAEALPKLDYGKGVPTDATTLVVVPTLLLHEKQVRELFESLESRYLSNEDPNIHFVLLTDLADSLVQPMPDERDPLVLLAMRQTESLNAKYNSGRGGSFLLLHRHRIFNGRQGVWMGWERKRGKLLDLNKLLQHEFDSFPIKAGPLHILDRVRYVITLDSDTRLPYSAAARMIGTMAHPLNRAIIDPARAIVTVGYGILQPRVGVSVSSASRSRLAAIYSGETGFDIYTRAVSDVYQDLFGEGIFTGKGIYEVSILHQVLERRFPRNSLLSHDLIEGAYVRAGLVTDVEVIDDYPSQYSAHTRRKHRWIRGDWQILRWLFNPVPDESGRMVPNPISLISQWKIFDNLRRSLVEPVTFLVLLCGWFFLPGGPLYWTVVTIALLLLPVLVRLAIELGKAVLKGDSMAAHGAVGTFTGSLAMSSIGLTFLAHQAMLSLDAILRTLIRSLYSGRNLLEWETAAQVESIIHRSSLDAYLQWSPVLAILLGAILGFGSHQDLYAASPVLLLWAIAPLVAAWLNSPPSKNIRPLTERDRMLLEQQALRIWRFYADFSNDRTHWLIPDNVVESGFHSVDMLTPTNVGMLFNARQAACELGFLTLPEFAATTLKSLDTYARLEKHRGHLYNWYELGSLRPIPPVVVSTVDSGNLAASLYTLHSGVLDALKCPLISLESFRVLDRIESDALHADAPRSLVECVRALFESTHAAGAAPPPQTQPGTCHAEWRTCEARRRRWALAEMIESCMPFLLPEFAPLAQSRTPTRDSVPALDRLVPYMQELASTLANVESSSPLHAIAYRLQARLPQAIEQVARLQADLATISRLAEQFAEQMDYRFLFNESRQLLSNGYDRDTQQLHTPCFDLLASEARMAAFLAVAKGDIPQESWFRLDRSHVLVKGRAVLLSWTATMFEYLMPTLWTRSYPNTLLTGSLEAAIRVQIDFVRGIPWGISESCHATTDVNGQYLYQAWGIPSIALKYGAEFGPVIAPYASFLALQFLPGEALANLRRMASLGLVGEYGFYEAADYIESPTTAKNPRIVRSWMAHHQGMSLLAITNVLRQNIFQTWFHANPRVGAAEQLLHEVPLSRTTLNQLSRQSREQAAPANR